MLLSVIFAATLPHGLALAQAAPSTYVMSAQVVANTSGPPATFGNPDAAFTLPGFFGTLANDLHTKRACALTNNGTILISLAIIRALEKTGQNGEYKGDTIFANGTISIDPAGGPVTGAAVLNEASRSSNAIYSVQLLDVHNLGTQVLVCGGQSSSTGGEPGTCSAPNVCAAGSECSAGGTTHLGAHIGRARLFLYPLVNSPELSLDDFSLCTGAPTMTWAECCNDPKLYIVLDLDYSASPDGTTITGTVTNTGFSGSLNAQLR
jgi:hypothetical protein